MEENNKFDIKYAILTKDVYSIRKFVDESSLNDILFELEQLNDLEVVLFFRFLKTEVAGELFSHLPEELQQIIVKNLTKKEITEIVNELYTDEVADLLEALPSDMAKTILLTVDKETRIKVNELLQFNDNEVGSVMSVDMILLPENLTNREALILIKKRREEAEIGKYFYIVDLKNRLLGATTLEDLIFNPKDSLIKENMIKATSIQTKQTKEQAAIIFANEDRSILPVVNEEGVVLGILTADDVIDIIHEEATEDLYKASGISLNQPTTSYLKTTIWSLVKSRVFWLVILMIGSTLSQVIIQFFSKSFEEAISTQIGLSSAVMIALIPVTSATSGNAGSQSTSTLTRALALGELRDDKMSRIIWKEFLVGLILGSILAVVNYIRLTLYYTITQDLIYEKTRVFVLLISLVSSISLLFSITLSKLLGTTILILGVKFKKDPTVMATPLLTTMIDGLATLIFFSFSFILLIPSVMQIM